MYQRIVVPVDGSPTSARGLQEAIQLATLTGAQLRLLHVVEIVNVMSGYDAGAVYTTELVEAMTQAGKAALEKARAQAHAAGVAADTRLIESYAARVAELVIEEARSWHADLIVIGTHGRRGMGRLMLGSDAEQIVRLAPVPVLLVRAPEVTAPPAGGAV